MVRPNPTTAAPVIGRNANYDPNARYAAQAGKTNLPPWRYRGWLLEILYDDRESRAGYPFAEILSGGKKVIVPRRKVHLATADYSVAAARNGERIDFRDKFIVERKAVQDLFSSLAGWMERTATTSRKNTSECARSCSSAARLAS